MELQIQGATAAEPLSDMRLSVIDYIKLLEQDYQLFSKINNNKIDRNKTIYIYIYYYWFMILYRFYGLFIKNAP